RRVRPLGVTVIGTGVAYFLLGGKSYYAMPAVLFALAAGAVPFARWATRRQLQAIGAVFVAVLLLLLPVAVPVLPLQTAIGYQIVGRIAMPTANAERGQPIARCTLDRTLAAAWPQILRLSG